MARRVLPAILFVGVAAFGNSAAAAGLVEGDRLAASAGIFDVSDRDYGSAEGRIEYRSGLRALALGTFFDGFHPILGLMANADGGLFGYGGVSAVFTPTDRLSIVPAAGVGGYRQGDSRPLGGVFEFHVAMSVEYAIDAQDDRVGVTFAHISNAGIHNQNPGVNSLLLTVDVPFH